MSQAFIETEDIVESVMESVMESDSSSNTAEVEATQDAVMSSPEPVAEAAKKRSPMSPNVKLMLEEGRRVITGMADITSRSDYRTLREAPKQIQLYNVEKRLKLSSDEIPTMSCVISEERQNRARELYHQYFARNHMGQDPVKIKQAADLIWSTLDTRVQIKWAPNRNISPPAQTLLILMDCQIGFSTGIWTTTYSNDLNQINRCMVRIGTLLPQLANELSIIAIQFQFANSTDTQFTPPLETFMRTRHVPFFVKRVDDMCSSGALMQYLTHNIAGGVRRVLMIGCTVPSCIRLSSLSFKANFPNTELIVDLHHCGSLESRIRRICPVCMTAYIAGTLNVKTTPCPHIHLQTQSPVERAVADMQVQGVIVRKQMKWNAYLKA